MKDIATFGETRHEPPQGPITRSRAKQIQEEVTLLILKMFEEPISNKVLGKSSSLEAPKFVCCIKIEETPNLESRHF